MAPTQIVATRYNADGSIARQRPACPYPQLATYRGTGDVNAAASFSCTTPAVDQLPTDAMDMLLIQNSLRQREVLTPNR